MAFPLKSCSVHGNEVRKWRDEKRGGGSQRATGVQTAALQCVSDSFKGIWHMCRI